MPIDVYLVLTLNTDELTSEQTCMRLCYFVVVEYWRPRLVIASSQFTILYELNISNNDCIWDLTAIKIIKQQ